MTCRFFKSRSGCKYGKSCRFLHEAVSAASIPRHTFTVAPEDHCETPGLAYDDIVPLLQWLATKLGKTSKELRIYDPYFCAGSVKGRLGSRGFPGVYNKNEDFYAAIAARKTPEYDVIITNPPYSEDHIEKIVRFCAESGKPWAMLIPNYVYVNPYYDKIVDATDSMEPFFIVPARRYQYDVPGGVRSEREKKTSPFLSLWYADLQDLNRPFIRHYRHTQSSGKCCPSLAGNRAQLPHNMRAQYDPTRRRLRKKQREALERRKRQKKKQTPAWMRAS